MNSMACVPSPHLTPSLGPSLLSFLESDSSGPLALGCPTHRPAAAMSQLFHSLTVFPTSVCLLFPYPCISLKAQLSLESNMPGLSIMLRSWTYFPNTVLCSQLKEPGNSLLLYGLLKDGHFTLGKKSHVHSQSGCEVNISYEEQTGPKKSHTKMHVGQTSLPLPLDHCVGPVVL